jgi:hypothetical protein
MRVLGALGLCLLVANCGLMAQQQQKDRIAQIKAQQQSIFADCGERYPKVKGQFVTRATCMQPGLELYRNLTPYPDLLDQEIALRMAVAEKLDTGKMTIAEGDLALTQGHSQIASEEQRRDASNRSVRAQESAAAGFSCTKVGNTINCF